MKEQFNIFNCNEDIKHDFKQLKLDMRIKTDVELLKVLIDLGKENFKSLRDRLIKKP